ncbi:cytochrome P450 3A40-like isoform X2 [Betta splendens]|uniref:Cytochrome P450 3A40-like isoform X2 n=1 Tax=Betta splendens TaxID=158456 RepID=A0A6P7MZL1_BETSP|nr:cytochrome P450 3A40-like isoform X2 [Betta splendens]
MLLQNLPLSGDLSDGVSLAENDQWRRIRNTLSPFFSSGHIKEMFGIMKHHSKKLTLSLRSKVQDGDTVTMKDFFGPYSVDVMGSCAFSVDMDSINNPTGPLITHASNLFNISKLLVIAIGCFPFVLPLLDLLGVSIFPKSSTAYFKTLLEKVKGERNDVLNQKLGDFLQHMMNYQSTKMHEPMNEKQRNGLTEHEILSQATLFVFAGYETSASALVFLAYNLATNPEVMQRLLREIDSTFPNKAPVQYEALMKMEYLDSVVKESLRLYPSATRLERTARETVKINGITIPKEMMVMIPVFALHRDPELWPEPEAFKPDRFSKENKQNINPYTYLPFGAGPRNCLGMRFALVVVKLALVEVLQNFVFSVCEETEIPLQMAATTFISTARPIKLKLVTRSNVSENGEKKNEE